MNSLTARPEREFIVTGGINWHNDPGASLPGREDRYGIHEKDGALHVCGGVGSMTNAEIVPGSEKDFILSILSPSLVQERVALGIVLFLLAAYFIFAGPLSAIRPVDIEAFFPIYVTAMFMSDLITAVLLFAQFSILHSRARLVIASGYLFTALILIPWILTFPGVFAPSGLLGAGVQSASWLYILWHAGFPMFVVAYALLKRSDASNPWQGSVRVAILSSAAVITAMVFAAALLVTVGQELLPRIVLDAIHFSPLWRYAAGFATLTKPLCTRGALGTATFGARSVVDGSHVRVCDRNVFGSDSL